MQEECCKSGDTKASSSLLNTLKYPKYLLSLLQPKRRKSVSISSRFPIYTPSKVETKMVKTQSMELLLPMPPEDPEMTLKMQLLHNAHPVQPRGQDALWPSTKQGERGTDLLPSLFHLKVIKGVICIRLQGKKKKKNQVPLSRNRDMKKPNELQILSPNLPSSLLQETCHQPPAILFPLQLSS